MTVVRADAVVIGAGAGGLCAAARLAHAGLHTIVVDDKERIGGRASTEQIDGFTVNIGAIAIELGGVFEETFNTVGAPLDIRTPEPASSFFIDGKLIDVGRGGWSLLLGQLTKQASRILEKFADARSGNLPDGRQSTEDWLKTYTSNASVHAIFRNLCAAIFACNADELPARAFLTYFTSKGAFKRFGFCPQGTIGVWNALGTAIKRNGDIWLSTPAVQIHTTDGRVEGVTVMRDGQRVRIETDLVISNAGPKTTVALGGEAAFPPAYVEQVRTRLRPAANIVINIASREPLISHPGIVTFGKTRRLCNMANLTATCPELAPRRLAPLCRLCRADSGARRFRLRRRGRAGADGPARAVPEFCAGQNPVHPRHARRLAGPTQLRRIRSAARDRHRRPVVRRRRRQAIRQWRHASLRRNRKNRHRRDPGAAAAHAAAEPGLSAMPTTIPTQANISGAQAAPDPSCLLEFRNIRIVYDNAIEAIRDVSIAVPEGGIVALLGSNGAGKSTLLKAMSGILYTEEGVIENGSIRFRNEEVHRLAPDELVRRGIVQVPEGRRVFPALTIDENLQMGGYTKTAAEARERREKVFALFPRLFERRDQIAGYMSGGEQQMLAIGRALMTDPVLLALDEPSLGLAPLIIDRIYEVIAKLRDEMKMTVLLVEQNAQRALDIADYAYILETGRVVLDGTAQKLASNEDVQEFYLGVSNSGRKSLRDVKHYKRRKRWLS